MTDEAIDLDELERLEREAIPDELAPGKKLGDVDYDIHIGCPPGSAALIRRDGAHWRTLVWGGILRHEDAAFFAALRNAAPQLIAAAERCSELAAENARLNVRRREMRQLLVRMVKYVREDRAETPGSTRLARLVESVADYLGRTGEPRDILRQEKR